MRTCPPIPFGTMCPLITWFVVTEAQNEDTFTVLRSSTDAVAMISIVVRGILILRHTKNILQLSKMLENDFNRYEKNLDAPNRLKRSLLVWVPSAAFALVCASSATMCAFALQEPGKVQTSARVPKQLEARPFLFRIIVLSFILGHWPTVVLNVISDGLIICTATVMQNKAANLKHMLDTLTPIKKDKDRQNKDLNSIIQYHNLICELHKKIEGILSGPMLVQLFFLFISVGSPLLQILFSDLSTMPARTMSFLISYMTWSSSQLTVYCLLSDAATHACMSVSKAAYFSYRSSMTPKVAQKLVLIMARAERPLHFTARGMFKINRKLLLKVLRRSYSLYSAIMNMR